MALAIVDERGAVFVIASACTASMRWGSLFHSGLHATRAGVLTACFVPARPRIVPSSAGFLEARAADGAGAISGLAFPGTSFERQAKLATVLRSLLAATPGIAVLPTIRPLEPDST